MNTWVLGFATPFATDKVKKARSIGVSIVSWRCFARTNAAPRITSLEWRRFITAFVLATKLRKLLL